MAPRKKSTGRKSEPKLFRCTGFGDCDMVFTRSEHLARHARKHTGEKPYKCVVPECGRMFSRFDNMMQHTQTHNRSGKRKSSPKPAAKNRRKSTSAVNNDWSEDEYTDGFKKNRSHSIHPTTQYNQWRSPSPPPASMMQSRTLPLPRRMSYSHSYYPPPLSKSPSLPDSPEEPPLTAFRSPSYYNMPPPPPLSSSTSSASSSALFYRRGSLQSTSSTSSTLSSDSQSFRSFDHGRRRLSAADLQAPIHSLKEENAEEQHQLHPLAKSPPAVVDITSDEYEALQGFGKFSSQKPHTQTNADDDNDDQVDDDDDLVLPAIQPNKTNSPSLSAQVAAFRQKLMPIHESFQRPVKGNAI
ncbi:hypothetical protein BCR42DRAFT_419835 [Absidia repens]|uniref:C2H2-type domain-containing protein n=1 Tax=Absidia repens TaxID=90262 RepID=A0A1X2IAE4_9FUNG|nr:hypothetical protein BCR42DRAFT_419835 [Absidia repens]